MKDNILSEKQELFCREYLKDFNGTQACIRAGYSKNSANVQASRLLANDNIQKYIKEISEGLKRNDIMDIIEVQQRLTAMARGQITEDVVVVEGSGDGCSDSRIIQKKVSAKDQVKALELLGKANGLFVDKVDMSVKNENAELVRDYIEAIKKCQ